MMSTSIAAQALAISAALPESAGPDERLAGTHPAPCARSCEANAYEIQIRQLSSERDALAAKLAIAQGMADTMAMLRSEMIDAGVIDASVAPMFFPESIIPRLLKLAELEGQTDNLLSTCHRLALELECLLLDTKDLAPVSRWWDSAMVALDEWHKAKDSVSARQIPAEPVNVDFGKRGENMFFNIGNQSFLLDYKPEEQDEFDFMKAMLLSAFSRITHRAKTESQPVNARLLEALKRLSFCAQTTGGVAGRDDELCSAIEASAKAITRAEASLAEPQPDADGPWKSTVIDQLVITHILTAEHESDPLKAIQDLLAYHTDIAVDPRVSGAAAKLVEQSKAEEREACAKVCVELFPPPSEQMTVDWAAGTVACANAIRARGQK